MKRKTGAVAAALAFGVGCGEATSVEPAPVPLAEPAPAMEPLAPEAPSTSPEDEARVLALTRWLDGCAVRLADPARGKLYSWTTETQVEELRRRGRLLSREASEAGELSGFDARLQADEHPLARFLRSAGHRARRFAWSNPWATRMGWEHGAYGEHLLEIELAEDAWTAIYTPDRDVRWQVLDAEGQPVAEPTRADFQRIAAVIHHGRGPDPQGRVRVYREAVIVNEQRVARWSVGTESIGLRLQRDAEELRRLATHWRAEPPELATDVAALTAWLEQGWSHEETEAPVLDRYRRCLALGTTAVRPDPEAAEALAATLADTPMPEPLTQQPRPPRRTYGTRRPPRFPADIIT